MNLSWVMLTGVFLDLFVEYISWVIQVLIIYRIMNKLYM